MTWTAVLTALIAIYGAALSTTIFIKDQKAKTRHISVKISNGFVTNGPELGELMLFVEVTNPGNRTVQVNQPKLILPDRKTMVFPYCQGDVRFPYDLPEGKNCKIWIEMKALASGLYDSGYRNNVKLAAGVTDGTGKEYKSKKPWILDIEMELKRS